MSEVENRVVAVLNELRQRIDYVIEDIDNKIIIDKDTRNLDGKCLEYELNIQKCTLVNVLAMIDDLLAKEQPVQKYRRFKYLDELPFNIGEVILYRLKGETGSESKALITEISYTNDDKCAIYCIGIGNKMLTTHELFADLELYNDDCEWQPFGILEE